MFFAFAVGVSCSAPAFTWPARYTIRGTWNVPYTNLSNPMIIVHEPNRQYTNQMNGVEQIWNTGPEEHFHRKIVGSGNGSSICYGYNHGSADWEIELTQFLPDPEGYETEPGEYTYIGHVCKLHTKSEDGGKTQTWKVYTDVETGYPVGYLAQAISMFGSHYDVYILNIDEFIPEALDGVWQLPSICTTPEQLPDDPYPGNTWNLFFPGKGKKSTNKVVNRFSHMDPKKWVKTVKKPRKLKTLRDEKYDLCDQWTPSEEEEQIEIPVNFSWRETEKTIVGPPRDQVACGSCWAFGTAELLESAFAMKTGEFHEISVNQVMDCTWDWPEDPPSEMYMNSGCQGGEVGWALTKLNKRNVTIAYEKDYPYIGVSGQQCGRGEDFGGGAGKVTKCHHIPRKTKDVKLALMKYGPLAIGINVVEGMLLYTGGPYDDQTCTGAESDLVHAVLLTGWKEIDGVDCWEVKNSWSTWWGYEGYVYIQAVNQEWNCGVTTDAVAVEVE